MVGLLLCSIVLTSINELASAIAEGKSNVAFQVNGCVTSSNPRPEAEFMIVDETGRGLTLRDFTKRESPLKAGQTIRAGGTITNNTYGIAFACARTIDILKDGNPPAPIPIAAKHLHSADSTGKLVCVRGTLREVFKDEIDPYWIYMTICDNGWPVYAAILNEDNRIDRIRSFAGAEVSVVGACNAMNDGLRRLTGTLIIVASPSDIQLVDGMPHPPFSAPLLTNAPTAPMEITTMGMRRIVGKVIAIWNGKFLLIEQNGSLHNVTFTKPPYPKYGDTIETEGFPETDLFRINLTEAIWKQSAQTINCDERARELSAADMLRDSDGNWRIDPRFHGRAIRIRGVIMDTPVHGSGQSVVTLKSDEFTIPINIGSCKAVLQDIDIGSTIAASGTCIVETENWHPYAAFPHATGITLVVRTPEDIVILSRPPWWTPQRLMIVVGLLLLVIVIVFIWNRILRRIIDRKSRQLLKEQVAQIKSELRVDERTHLAVELHDTLSQNLSGVACQIAATKGTLLDGADETARYLETAERMLLSCRTELRRCLWDLRGDTLEEANFNEAIRKTLAPVAIGVESIIRFNVPRSPPRRSSSAS